MQQRMHAATRWPHVGPRRISVRAQCPRSRKLLVHSVQPETRFHPVASHPADTSSTEGDLPSANLPQHHGSTFSSMEGAAASHASSNPAACPFLSTLPLPPKATAPWAAKHLQVTNPLAWLEAAAKGREVVQGAFMLKPTIVALTPSHARTILSGEGQWTSLGWPEYFNELIGPGTLSTSVGQHHDMLRALLQPVFTAEGLAGFLPRVVDIVEEYLAAWAAAEGGVPGADQIKLMTFTIILQVVVGPDYTKQQVQELSALFKTWLGGLFVVPTWNLPFLPYGAAMKARHQLGQHIQAAIARERQREAAGLAPQGVLGKLLTAVDEHGNRLADIEVESNVINLLFAGHDTSSSTLAMVLCHLTTHPRVMERLRQEQQQVVAAHGPGITTSVLKAMPYAEAVIRETLRLNSTVGGMMRRAATDFQLGPWRIPSSASLFVSLAYMARHDPRWSAPKDVPAEVASQQGWGTWAREEFNPDLLLTEEGKKTGWLMPFGYGNRYCIGAPLAMMEMKVVLALLARQYKAVAVPLPTHWGMVPMPTPSNGLPLVVAPLGPDSLPASHH